MSKTELKNKDHSRFETISDDNPQISISELAEMISMYYDEIKSIAKNLEEESSPLPSKDIDDLHSSLLEYARIGTEFTEKFRNRAEKLDIPVSDYPGELNADIS